MWVHLTPSNALIKPNSARQQSHYSPTTNSQSKIPSKLRDSSTASFLDRSSASSRSSSPEGIYVATPASSFSGQSPHLAAGAIGNGGNSRGRPLGTGPPRRPSPPRPLAIHPPHFGLGESQIWHFSLSLAQYVLFFRRGGRGGNGFINGYVGQFLTGFRFCYLFPHTRKAFWTVCILFRLLLLSMYNR